MKTRMIRRVGIQQFDEFLAALFRLFPTDKEKNMREHSELERLWSTHATEVETYIRRRIGCPQLSQDITSDVFLAVARTLQRKPELVLTPGFLFTVAHRRVVDAWRSRSRQRNIEHACQNQFAVEVRITAPDPIEHMETPDWLNLLPDRQRTALTLRYLEDLSVGEVAERMGESYGVVESLLARGRRSAHVAASRELAAA